jgi:hypothetical protein
MRQNNDKKAKVGGFEDGIVLQKTALPIFNSIDATIKPSSKNENQMTFWVDTKEKSDHKEIIKNGKPPALPGDSNSLTFTGI